MIKRYLKRYGERESTGERVRRAANETVDCCRRMRCACVAVVAAARALVRGHTVGGGSGGERTIDGQSGGGHGVGTGGRGAAAVMGVTVEDHGWAATGPGN